MTPLALMGWGFAFGGVPASFQGWVFQVARAAPETGSALLSSALQLAIALGSALGGLFMDVSGPRAALWFGATLTLAGRLLIGRRIR